MDEEDKVVLDYSSDPLMVDGKFRHSILSSIARAGSAIEELYGSAQDIEGVIRDGKVYVVQTRPQMWSWFFFFNLFFKNIYTPSDEHDRMRTTMQSTAEEKEKGEKETKNEWMVEVDTK